MTNWFKSVLEKCNMICKVPDEIAVCEFDCRINDCKLDQWKNCRRRIAYVEGLSLITYSARQPAKFPASDMAHFGQ